jgi:hypothetical protein
MLTVNRPFNCGSSSSHFLASLLPTRDGGSACPVGVAETGRAPVGDAIANHTVFDLTSPAVSNAVVLMSALGSRSFPRSRSAS